MRIIFSAIWVFIQLMIITSCVSHQQLVNYQEDFSDKTKMDVTNGPDIRIEPNDVLGIKVFSSEAELAAPFNLNSQEVNANLISIEAIQLNGYLVNQKGEIDFPVLGRLKWTGLSISEAKESLLVKLKVHLIKEKLMGKI